MVLVFFVMRKRDARLLSHVVAEVRPKLHCKERELNLAVITSHDLAVDPFVVKQRETFLLAGWFYQDWHGILVQTAFVPN